MLKIRQMSGAGLVKVTTTTSPSTERQNLITVSVAHAKSQHVAGQSGKYINLLNI